MGRRRRRTARVAVPHRRPLRIEPLEDRRLLAVATVTTLDDTIDFTDGVTSLREAIFATNTVAGADTIEFAASLTAGGLATMLLAQGELVITDALLINGPGANLLTIDAQQQSRIFSITATTGDFTIVGLTLTHGHATGNNEFGGAIYSATAGMLTLDHMTVSANEGFGQGGGIYAASHAMIVDSSIVGNSSGRGGGVFAGALTLTRSTITGNNAMLGGDGAFALSSIAASQSTIDGNLGIGLYSLGQITLTDCTVSGNDDIGVFTRGEVSVSGGAVLANGGRGISAYGNVNVTGATVSGNINSVPYIAGPFRDAGGVYSRLDITIANSTVSSNTSTWGNGGGVHGRTVTISGSTISDNTALGTGAGGGGVYASLLSEGVFETLSHFSAACW